MKIQEKEILLVCRAEDKAVVKEQVAPAVELYKKTVADATGAFLRASVYCECVDK